MYTITKTGYGFHIVIGGRYSKNDVERYVAEKERLISACDGPFSVLVDARTVIPAQGDDIAKLKESQEKMADKQLQRMAIVVSSPVIMRQAQQIGFMSGVAESTRFINASKTSDWEKLSLDWVVNGIEPALTDRTGGSSQPSHSC